MAELYTPQVLRRNFSRAHATMGTHRAIHQEIGTRLVSRLSDMRRTFETVLDLGSGVASFADDLAALNLSPRTLIHADITPQLLRHPKSVVLNAEHPLPFPNGSFDLILSNQMLHWINNVPQTFMNIGRALKPDGLFLASTLGQDSFYELKAAFAEAGSTRAHVIPLTDIQSAGAALQKVGFTMPVVDRDTLTVTYPSFTAMYADLRSTGSRNLHPNRGHGLMTPRLLSRMEDAYRNLFARPDGTLPLTLEILYLHGWRPHESQQKALKPGTATVSLDEVLSTLRGTPQT